MNVIIKKRQLLVAALTVALGAAVLVNWYFTNSGDKKLADNTETTSGEYVQNLGEAKYVNAEGKQADYFAETQLKREKAHDESLEELNKSLTAVPSGSEEAQAITASITALTDKKKLEADIEALVSAKLGSACIAVINDGEAEIVVKKGSLNDDAVLKVMEIIESNTDIPASNVKITES